MKFSICLECNTTLADFRSLVKSTESLGFQTLWLTDLGLNSNDVFAYMTMAMMQTSRLSIGAAVHPPQLRHPAITLNTLVTLNRLSAGRMIYGIGTGDEGFLSVIGRRSLKLRSLAELVELSRRLLRGETVSSDTGELVMRDARLSGPIDRQLPIYLAATGPRTLALAGAIADGVLAHVGANSDSLSMALETCARQNNEPETFDFTPYLYLAISADKSCALADCRKGARTIAIRAPHLARLAGCTAEEEKRLREGHSDIESIITAPLIDRLTLAGTKSDVTAKLNAIAELGIEHVTLYPRGKDIARQLDIFGRQILPQFSG